MIRQTSLLNYTVLHQNICCMSLVGYHNADSYHWYDQNPRRFSSIVFLSFLVSVMVTSCLCLSWLILESPRLHRVCYASHLTHQEILSATY